jgi:AraC-like DNA-binding protein
MTFKKIRFYKYITVDEEVKQWGIYLTGAGHITVDKHTIYPLTDDPSHHYFHWSTGRRLSDYQILYIIKGKGIFESELTGYKKINAGDIFILFPGVWHRFTPDIDTGWEEYWIEFNGDLIKHYRKHDFLNPENPILKVGIHEDIAENFLEIIRLISDEKPGFQYIASGNLIQILGQAFTSVKYQQFEGRDIENQIRQARLMLHENMHVPILQEDVAMSIGLGYSVYRKKFKEYTGVSPAQYQINLRINKAKDLLITSNQSLKEISNRLGFESTDYFYRLFKKKTGYTPSDYREKNDR